MSYTTEYTIAITHEGDPSLSEVNTLAEVTTTFIVNILPFLSFGDDPRVAVELTDLS